MEIPFNNEFMINTAKAESSINGIKNSAKSSHELQKAAQDFEAVLLNMVLKAM
jgi:Rod binding domain-containing protein